MDTIILCLDHDAAGIEACGRLAEILKIHGHNNIKRLRPKFKDWNEDLKDLNGEQPIPAEEHPKLIECASWVAVLKEAAETIQTKNANKQNICRYYLEVYQELKKGNLKDRANKEGICYPAIGTIARELGLSVSTVKRVIVDLEENGFIQKEQRWRDNGGRSSLLFKIKK